MVNIGISFFKNVTELMRQFFLSCKSRDNMT